MVQINPVVYALLQAHISEHLSMKARAQVIAIIATQRPDLKELQQTEPAAFQIEFDSMVALRVMELTTELQNAEQMTEKGDPLVELKQRELDLRAMDMQRRSMEFGAQEQRKTSEFDQRIDLDKMKREDAEVASKERIRVADEKLGLNAIKVANDAVKQNR